MSRGNVIAVVAAVAAAAVVIVLVARGGSKSNESPTTAAPGQTSTGAKGAPSQAQRGHRAAVVKGQGSRPDEPAPGTGALLAIADQKPQTFADPRFRALGVARSRLNTPWNSVFTEPGRLGAWLNAARAAGVEPLVAFEHARGDGCPAAPCTLPSVANYERAVRAFHLHFPWVRLIQPWNEANSATQPTGKHPDRAAAYYSVVKRVCGTCVVPAADVLDASNLARWLTRFKSALHGATPRLWGLHNYSDVNHMHDTGTRKMLALVPGEVWLTETGGIVSFTTGSGKVAFPTDADRAARATDYMFKLADRFPRIKRMYIYQWKIDFPGNRFDAGLVDQSGNPRPALDVVKRRGALLR